MWKSISVFCRNRIHPSIQKRSQMHVLMPSWPNTAPWEYQCHCLWSSSPIGNGSNSTEDRWWWQNVSWASAACSSTQEYRLKNSWDIIPYWTLAYIQLPQTLYSQNDPKCRCNHHNMPKSSNSSCFTNLSFGPQLQIITNTRDKSLQALTAPKERGCTTTTTGCKVSLKMQQ